MSPKDVTEDDVEMAKEFLEQKQRQGFHLSMVEDWPPLARLIAEVRTEQREIDAAICEDYAGLTTFTRKAQAGRELARRIIEGPSRVTPRATDRKGGKSQ
jgi:hypothetical protein